MNERFETEFKELRDNPKIKQMVFDWMVEKCGFC